MRKMIVSGHLGANPEIKTTNRGTQYTTFRIANHEFGDAENVTYWFTVTVWEPTLQKFCQSLKKGSLVYVDGEYTDRTYLSNKTNTTDVGRDLRATAIYFGQGNKREDDTQAGQTAPVQANPVVTPTETPAPEPAAPVAEEPVPDAAPASEGGDDDLPF